MQRFKQNDKNMKDGHQNATFPTKTSPNVEDGIRMGSRGSGSHPVTPAWHLRDTCVTSQEDSGWPKIPSWWTFSIFWFWNDSVVFVVVCKTKIPKLCKHWAIIFIQSGCSWFLYSGPSARSTQWAKQFACWVVRFHSAKLVRINAQLWHGIETCQNNKCIDTSTTLCPKQR